MFHTVKAGETLKSISEDYRVSLSRLIKANPGIGQNGIHVGQKIVIPGVPSPETIPYQISVSLSARTLTLTHQGRVLKVYPVGVGKMLTRTPVGSFVIINKSPNPGGPYGTMWMSLSKKSYGIHGTNNPASIGKYVSKGCIRMYNHDVEQLAKTVPIGTQVNILY
ncbi:L,D-transpeptidase family protein [Bacillus sp. REN10]|uniref:L,D-transpeptidase family protein n=1 Tax=Bacillus sp. REN10 TaxID=2782541 RepID=UPI00193BDFBF|nr:L,D-transpeptidase family protein [Bacillus sp. REN10]